MCKRAVISFLSVHLLDLNSLKLPRPDRHVTKAYA